MEAPGAKGSSGTPRGVKTISPTSGREATGATYSIWAPGEPATEAGGAGTE